MHHRAKFNQNRSKGCRDMVIWRFSEWRPSAILDLWNSNFVTVGAVKRPILHQLTTFRNDRSNGCGDIVIFVIFKDGGRRHFGFSKIRNLNGISPVRGQCASLYQILSKSVKRLQRYSDFTDFFQNGGRPPSWICWAPIGTTRNEFLLVSIVVQNLVEIDTVLSITQN